MTRWTRAVMAAVALRALTAAPSEAIADDAHLDLAQAYFEKGNAAYNLDRFDEAASWFAKSYEAWPTTDLLYNIAQAYRRAGACKQALAAYQRYLSLKEHGQEAPLAAQERAEIEHFVAEATACVADESSRSSPPAAAPPATQPARMSIGTTVVNAAARPAGPSRRLSAYAAGGTAWFDTGEVDTPVQPSFAIGGRYALPAGPLTVAIGARGAFSSIRYEETETKTLHRASLLSALATVDATCGVIRRLSVRVELGAGVAVARGLVPFNPLTESMNAGVFTMPWFRGGIAVEYAITARLSATFPSVGLSLSPAPGELRIRKQLDALLGLGYRM
jgi:hypothetical protein